MAAQDDTQRDRLIADERGIYQHIAADHRKVESLFDELESAGGDLERMRELHVQLKREILLHANVEDRVVYTPLELYEQFANTIVHARDAHSDANALLLELDELEFGGQEFMNRAERLKEVIEAHVEEEENEILPAAFDVLDESTSRELARTYESEKEIELETLVETEPGVAELDKQDFESMSREDLAELARQRNIEGRSQMSKSQLSQALRDQR